MVLKGSCLEDDMRGFTILRLLQDKHCERVDQMVGVTVYWTNDMEVSLLDTDTMCSTHTQPNGKLFSLYQF